MNINIVKLKIDGDLIEESVYIKKDETFNIGNFNKKINDDDKFDVLYEWDLDKINFDYKDLKLILVGSESEQLEEHEIFIHPLPINDEYEFYGDLYTILLNNNKYVSLSLDTYEEFNNNIYLKIDNSYSDSEENDFSDEELDNENDNDDDDIIDDYGDNNDEEDYISDDESIIDEDEKKKKIKKKKNY